MSTRNVNLLWKNFRGIRKLNSINSDSEFGADIAHGVRLSKEKSGQFRSIRSSGWFNRIANLSEPIIRLFSANFSNYTIAPDQLIAFTSNNGSINVWLVMDSATVSISPIQIATFSSVNKVTDVCMTQWGDRLGMVIAFGEDKLGFVYYSADAIIDGTQFGTTGFYYKEILLSGVSSPLSEVTRVKPYGSRLAVNGITTYSTGGGNAREMIYGVWFSEAGNPTNFTEDPMTDATETSAFFVETGEYVTQLEQYHGLTAFCRNHSYNITGSSQTDARVMNLTAKGVFGNATFTINGKCGYIDSWAKNIFALRDNIDGTIGFDEPVGDDIQDYLNDIDDVTVNILGRRVRITKSNGQSLVYDVDIAEWTEEAFTNNARVVTFLNNEYLCDGTDKLYKIIEKWELYSQQTPNEDGYYSHYRTNLIWLDSQSSVKSHLYPFAIILEPQTSNNFYIKFTTDRGKVIESHITKAGFENIATYSINDDVPDSGGFFVTSDSDTSGGIFFSFNATELLVTAEQPPFWRYLQIDIYTISPEQQFNISGIEAKNTVITDEMLDY